MGIMQQIKEQFASKFKKEHEFYTNLNKSFTTSGDLMSVSRLLAWAAQKFSTAIALSCCGKEISYQELYFRASLLCKKLKDAGVMPGDRVVLYVQNSIEFYIGYFAIWQAGAVGIPLNVFLHERELAYVLKDSEAKAIITTEKLNANLDKVQALGNELPKVFTEKAVEWDPKVPETFEALEQVCPVVDFKPDEMCLLLYTSGTTGTPKGVMLSSRNVMTNAMQSSSRFNTYSDMSGSKSQERFFACLPLFHVFAQNCCIWFPMLVGATIIVVPKIERSAIMAGLAEKPTILCGVPALYGLLCLLKTAPLESVKFFVSGGDALPDKIRSAFAMIYGRKISSGYGLTEASPVVAINMENADARTNVVGMPLPGINCDIRGEDGKSFGIGKVGELWISGDNVMLGYFKAPEESSRILKDGWLDTGDLATIDNKGYIAISGRSKELIIHKGFNIYPQEVENILLTHPAVFKAAVIGREDAIAGQVPIAFVALKEDGASNIEHKLREFCSSHLASYKIPRKFICLDDLPMNQTGKISKKDLKVD